MSVYLFPGNKKYPGDQSSKHLIVFNILEDRDLQVDIYILIFEYLGYVITATKKQFAYSGVFSVSHNIHIEKVLLCITVYSECNAHAHFMSKYITVVLINCVVHDMNQIETVLTTQNNVWIPEVFGTRIVRAPGWRNLFEVRVTKVVDGVVIDVTCGLAALDVIISSRQQVFDPVPDIGNKALSFRGLLAEFVHVLLKGKVAVSSCPAKRLALFGNKRNKEGRHYSKLDPLSSLQKTGLIRYVSNAHIGHNRELKQCKLQNFSSLKDVYDAEF